MTSNGMYANCSCHAAQGCPSDNADLTLLSQIPNQRIYRCINCHSFLSFTEDTQTWDILMPGDIEEEIKGLYQDDASSAGAA